MCGTATRAYYTVSELTFSSGWPNYARPLMEEVNDVYVAFFIFYITLIVFAMFCIITTLLLEGRARIGGERRRFARSTDDDTDLYTALITAPWSCTEH